MGIIQRQALKNAITGFLGTGIAAVATLFVYPLEINAYGLAQYVFMTAAFFSSFASFGTPALVVKFFPSINRDADARSAFLFNILLISILTYGIMVSLAAIFKNNIYSLLENLQFDMPLIQEYAVPIIFLTFIVMLTILFIQHASNYRRIVIPEILQNLLPKIVLPSLVLLIHFAVIGDRLFVRLWLLCHVVIFVALFIYLARLGALSLKPQLILLKKGLIGKMLSFASFNGLSMMGNVLVNRLDIIMVATLLGTEQAGYYAIALFIANIIYIPTRAIWSISSPIIAEAWESGDMREIGEIYQKAAVNTLVIGIILFFLLYGSLEDIFSFSPRGNELTLAIPIFFWLGISKLVDMGGSVNTLIIMHSDKYRYNLLFTLIIGGFNVVLNYSLIHALGVAGAALATAISIATVNLLRMLFIAWQFRLLPFDATFFKILLLGAVATGVYYLIPAIASPVLHLVVYCSVLTAIYAGVFLLLRVSPELVLMAKAYFRRLLSLWK